MYRSSCKLHCNYYHKPDLSRKSHERVHLTFIFSWPGGWEKKGGKIKGLARTARRRPQQSHKKLCRILLKGGKEAFRPHCDSILLLGNSNLAHRNKKKPSNNKFLTFFGYRTSRQRAPGPGAQESKEPTRP